MQTIELPQDWQGESAIFIEGAILAANLAVKPLEPEHWCQQVGVDKEQATVLLVPRINQQYNMLKRSEYSLLNLDKSQLADFAEGFMSVWPTIEVQYQEIQLLDSTLRMLQALLTTFMLAIDEQQTQQQMRESGIDNPPSLHDLLPQLDVMLTEVALAADEQLIGTKGQSVNPYKNIGRNDICPCGSGKKFKLCCGK
ncbi:SEC-C metal-binding domain-containing protein [Vibrio sp. TH_r3]|uniref:YecA/YgfB family protein n=1 Tax=Vibrio sp. TH_r3 TaxID=3082084 RepID=UPI0029536725|nr:SEC-C metal-binding domain-containing protein [Vibrio sp. TH_r3]MDV7103983.1 SEC-C metal-binding domain-containing protein [Vibrio sp. TH_r3]